MCMTMPCFVVNVLLCILSDEQWRRAERSNPMVIHRKWQMAGSLASSTPVSKSVPRALLSQDYNEGYGPLVDIPSITNVSLSDIGTPEGCHILITSVSADKTHHSRPTKMEQCSEVEKNYMTKSSTLIGNPWRVQYPRKSKPRGVVVQPETRGEKHETPKWNSKKKERNAELYLECCLRDKSGSKS